MTKSKKRAPYPYKAGDVVRGVFTGTIHVVKRSYWQNYAGGDTADYTVEFEPTERLPRGWDKSSNLEPFTGRRSGLLIADDAEPLPLCAQAMGCLCACHAAGMDASEPCDTSEDRAREIAEAQ